MAVLYSRQYFTFLNLLLIFIIFTNQAKANNNTQNFHYFCDQNNERGNYTTNSTYETNLNTLLSTLISNTQINYGFYNFSFGENTNRITAIGLCRGDLKPNDCRSCLNKSKANLTQVCPNKKEAIGWYEDEKCMLRYSDRSIFSLNEIGPAYFAWSLQNATSLDAFNEAVENLLQILKIDAAAGDSSRKFAAESEIVGIDNKTIYGLAQCTPDLSGPQCVNCLNESITEISRCCKNRIGARIVRPSCNLRFETSFQFYQTIADSPSQQPLSPIPSASPYFPDQGNVPTCLVYFYFRIKLFSGNFITMFYSNKLSIKCIIRY